MIRLLFSFYAICCTSVLYGQNPTRSLPYYIETARNNSPLIRDYHNQIAIQQNELQRLKAFYTRSRVELNGDYLFVPIIVREDGKTSFKWNAKDATDYYGYDLGESSGSLHAGINWTQPLLGNKIYKTAKEQAQVHTDILNDNIRMEKHQLERSVKEQYILCLLDKQQIDLADSITETLNRQRSIVQKMIQSGSVRQSDLHLLTIEQAANDELRIAALQSYHTHLMDLNILCGIKDTAKVDLEHIDLQPDLSSDMPSSFWERYRLDSLNTVASLNTFHSQYKPQLNLFVTGGLQIGEFAYAYKHFGWSAGLTFSWTLFDGKQKRWKERQTRVQLNTIETYKVNFQNQNHLRIQQYLTEIQRYDKRKALLRKQSAEYEALLADYRKEIQAGQLSVIDYITVLKSKIQVEKNYLLLQTNRQLLVAAFNYWNW